MSKRRVKTKADTSDRDAQLRRRMLTVARLNAETYSNGYVPFSLFAAVKDDVGQPVDNEEQAVALIGDLHAWGLLDEAPAAGLGGSTPTNRHRRFKLTKKAWELWMQGIPPIPGVADDRVM